MTKGLPLLLLAVAVPLAMAPAALGQSLQVSVAVNGSTTVVQAGGSETLSAAGVNQPVYATVTVANSGTAAATITGVTVTGTSQIALSAAPAVPVTLNPSDTTNFTVEYLPTSGTSVTAQVAIAYTANNQSANFLFNLTGTAPLLTFTYAFPPSETLTTLTPGNTIAFPATNVGSPVPVTVNILNSGSGAGSLSSVGVTGAAFQVSNSPAPVSIPAGQQISVTVLFVPQAAGSSQGSLTLTFPGTSATFPLLGTGTTPTFSATYTLANGNVFPLSTGTAIPFPSVDINATTTAVITIANQGTGSGTVTGISITGSAFQLTGLPALPATVPAGQSVHFSIVFAPTQSGSFSGTYSITFSGGSLAGALTGSTAPSNISLAYIDPTTNSTLPLSNNSTLPFPNTAVGSVTNVTVLAINSGTGTGFVNSVTLAGGSSSAFQLLNLPPFPASVPPSQQATFGLRFTPQQPQSYSGTLLITVNGTTATINLTASGTGPQYTYSVSSSSGTTALSVGGTVAVPNTSVGQTTSLTISVTNGGNASGQIPNIGVTGQGLSLANLPALPLTLAAGASQPFTLSFAPTQAGSITGQLIIGSATFAVTATANGATSFAITYTLANGNVLPISSGTTITFPSVDINATSTATITITNQGANSGTVTAVSVTGSAFQLSGLPALPATVAAGQSIHFAILFTPTQSGTFSGTFAITDSTGSASGTLAGSTAASNISLAYTDPTTNSTLPLANGSTLPFPSTQVGSVANITVLAINSGAGTGFINSVTLGGASASVFQLVNLPAFPLSVPPNQQGSFGIRFTPLQSQSYSATLVVTVNGQATTINLSAQGTQPALSITYTLANGNVLSLTAGTTITFPPVDINVTTTATITVSNQGTGSGTVTGISLTGSAFQLTGLPALPATIAANQSIHFGIAFSTTQSGTYSGTYLISYSGGSVSGALSASTAPSNITLAYTDPTTNSTVPLANNSTLTVPTTQVGSVTNITVLAINSGTGTGFINSVALGGASSTAFQLLNLPPFPLSVPPSQQATFGIRFTPLQPQAYTATLVVTVNGQPATITLSAQGTGALYTYTASTSSSTTTFGPGGTLAIASTTVGQTTSETITVVNNGSGSGQIASISVSGQGLTVTNLPPLPLTLASGASQQFTLSFAPTQAGTVTGQLTIGTATFIVSAPAVAAQPTFAVTYTLANGNVLPLNNGTTIAFPAVDINGTTTASIVISNTGGSGTVTGISVSGSAFQLTGLPALPATVGTNQSTHFGIAFAPTQTGSYTGTFLISYNNGSLSGTLTGSTAPSNISLEYIDPTTNNVIPLQNNATLPFPNTAVGSVTNITVAAPNTGTGTGSINSVVLGGVTGTVFQLLSLPPFPASVPPSQQATFGVRFTPAQQQGYTATLTVTVNGQPITVNLSGQGIAPVYTYSVTNATGSTPLAAGGTVAIANTNVGQTTSVTVSVTNNGTSNGQIPIISVTGQGLSLSNVPPLPVTLAPNASQQFTLNFAPTQPGAITGQLTVGGDMFTVSATGIGPLLTYSYANSVGTTSVAAGGTVVFAPLAVGSTESVNFTVQNTGTSAATISSINLAAASTVFTLAQLPGLPLSLAPNATITFTASFAPNNTGTLTATLAVDTTSFVLSGTGTPPPSLPAYQFQGPSGTLPAAQQPAIGLSLSSAYPLAVQGTLTLTFVSDVFTDDPSIQFANGGRTVNFTIPANSTQAVFGGNNTTVSMQSGTTAGSIVITPSFATQSGFNLTPASPTVLTLTVPHAVPQLTAASITSATTNSFTLVLNGYSTTRVLTTLNVQFTPNAGTNLTSSNLSISVSTASAAWFQSTASDGFGGSFVVAIPFTLQGGSASANLVSLLQSLSITAVNDVGTSSALSVVP